MKKWHMGLLTICVILSLVMPVFAALPSGTGRITNPNHVSGREFSPKSSIAKKLDKMFAGDIGLYVDKNKTKLVNAALGTYSVPNNGRNQYWANGHAGTSCFAYANAFYSKFYDDFSPHDSPNGNHQRVKATGKISYENFVKWGVRDDAAVYIREGNHSVVVLHYDKNYITYVDGNGDGRGLVALRKEVWGRSTGSNIYNQKPSLIVQPKKSYFAAGSMQLKQAKPCTEGGSFHDWDEGVITRQATCKEKGIKTITCLACGKTKEETIAKTKAHTFGQWTVKTEATCTQKGKQVSTCTVCGETQTKTTKALDHSYGKAVTTQEATCTEKGKQVQTCTVCGDTKTKTTKALDHSYGKAVTVQEATIYSAGITEKTCSRCQKVKQTKTLCSFRDKASGIILTAKEKVFQKNTEILITPLEEMDALHEISGQVLVYDIFATVKDEAVQPKDTFTLEMEIPEGFGENLALYGIGETGLQKLESTLEDKTLTAQLESLQTVAVCNLDVPYVPPVPETELETEATTEATTEVTTQPMTEIVTVPVETKQAQQPTQSDYVLLIAIGVTGLFAVGVIVLTVLELKKRKQKEETPTV